MLEKDLALNNNFGQCSRYKNELETILQKIADGVKIRIKCNRCKHGKKSSVFLKLREAKNHNWSI